VHHRAHKFSVLAAHIDLSIDHQPCDLLAGVRVLHTGFSWIYLESIGLKDFFQVFADYPLVICCIAECNLHWE